MSTAPVKSPSITKVHKPQPKQNSVQTSITAYFKVLPCIDTFSQNSDLQDIREGGKVSSSYLTLAHPRDNLDLRPSKN